MSLSKEEKIVRLRRGIASPETSDALKKIMEQDLADLMKPEPVFIPEPIKPKAIKKPVKKVEVKKEEPPPPIPERTFSAEEKEKLKEEYAQRRLRKKEKENG